MNNEDTAEALTRDDFKKAVAEAGGAKAIHAAFDRLGLANIQLAKDYDRILEDYPGHWIAMGPNGMIANVVLPEGSTDEEEEQAMENLFRMIEEAGGNRTGCLVRYIDPKGGALIL